MTNPLAWLLLLVIAGWLLRRRTWAVVACAVGGAMVLLAMTPPAAYGLTRLWEREFSTALPCQDRAPDVIILLPAGVRKPAVSRGFSTLTHKSLLRLERALALSVRHGDAQILVSGTDQETAVFREVAGQWGRASMLAELPGPQNTLQAAAAAAGDSRVSGASVWLLTSALHMRRSKAAFEHFGLEVCPVGVDVTEDWAGVFPDYRSVGRLDILLHEVVGLAYYQLRFRLA